MSLFSARSLIQAAAVALAVGALAAPASADPWHGGWHHGWRHGPGYGPRFGFAPPPVYYAPSCVIRTRWEPSPWGLRPVRRRICY